MYGWIGKNFYNHRVILTSTIEYDNLQKLRKFKLSEPFFLCYTKAINCKKGETYEEK